MKFPSLKNGHLGLLLSLSILVSCNAEEYYAIEELVEGADAYCSQAKDLNSCQALGDICQPAYEPLEIETAEPVFSACIANPEMWDPNYNDPSTDPNYNDPSTDPATDPSTDPATDPSSDPATDPSTDPATSEPAPGSSNPGNSFPGQTHPGNGHSSNGVNPEIQDAIQNKCQNLDPSYLYVKKEIKKKKVISSQTKVKICHHAGNSSRHTIVIACPALKAHVKHHDDYLGACEL